MPTYEYECQKCGHRFDFFQSMNDAPLRVCERCGGEVKRLPGMGAGFLFKGSGFYQTDYRSKSYRDKAKQEKGETKPAEGGKEAKPAEGGKEAKSPGAGDTGAKKPESKPSDGA